MATYHLSAKIGKKGKAQAHAAYIAREGKYSEGSRYEDLEATAYGNMPQWAEHNPAHFWQAADENERANGSVYRELEVALPRELTPDQRLALVQDFVQQELGENHAYQFAIHTPKAALEKNDQPHAHIMYSERIRDGIERDPEQYFKRYNAKHLEKGGNKKFSGGKNANELKAELLAQRERWADLQNNYLEKYGHSERVDHRSLKDQGITEREPEKHLGGTGVRNTYAKNNLLELRAATAENIQAQAELLPILEHHKKETFALDYAAKIAKKYEEKQVAKALADAELQQAEQQRQAQQEQADSEKAIAQQHIQPPAEPVPPKVKVRAIENPKPKSKDRER